MRDLDPAHCGGEAAKKGRLLSMERYLHDLKVLADINDPVIKKRFEDGQGMFIHSPFNALSPLPISPILAHKASSQVT